MGRFWSSEELQEAHNKGQADGAKNSHHPPFSEGWKLVTSCDALPEWDELNDAYEEGWQNGFDSR
jgi:hypothetical protein